MSETTLYVGAALALATGAIHLYVGHRIWQRPMAGDRALAQALFVVFWYAIGLNTLLGGFETLLYISGNLSIAVFATTTEVGLLAATVALWGVLYFLIYLYTGSKRSLWPLSVIYAAFWIYLVYVTEAAGLDRITDDGWNVVADPNPFTGTTLLVVLLVLIGPQIAASFALLRLFFKVDGATQKYRILLISQAFLIWFGLALIASITGLSELAWWPLVSRLLSLGAALAVLAAYLPPRFVQRRLGVQPIDGA